MRRTKIVATIGPASESRETLAALVDGGLDVARLNASHSSIEQLEERLRTIREVASAKGVHTAVMLDVQGPKVRLGSVRDGVVLRAGARFALAADGRHGDGTGASVSERALIDAASPGDAVVIGDGEVELEVVSVEAGVMETKVAHGGPLASRKGVTARGVSLDVPPLTADDEAYVLWGLRAGVDLFAQSFVRTADDVAALRALVGDLPVVAKIERHEALEDIEGIVGASDGVMVARGDLGVATSPERVPIAQKRIVGAARAAGKPVIVATQMLESMLDSPEPTRAEASDVANAVFDAVDAVMLSGETAVGRYPVEAVAMMDRIARMAEGSGFRDMRGEPGGGTEVSHAVSAAVCELADRLDLAAIVTATRSGATARSVAAQRPDTQVVAVASDAAVARRLAPVWGVTPVLGREPSGLDELMEIASEAALATCCAPGDLVAITAGVDLGRTGGTDLIQVHRL